MKDVRIDYTGKQFGYLTCLKFEGIVNMKTRWLCRCKCGVEKIFNITNIVSGTTKSCGCLKTKSHVGYNITHNMSKSPEYKAWRIMRDRCYNSKKDGYEHYGGRGIKVCDRWFNSFENFYMDMGKKPSSKHSLDRYPNVNGDYCKENCRWATMLEQNGNKRNNVWVEAFGKKMIIADWEKELGVKSLRNLLRYKNLENIIKENTNYEQRSVVR